MRKNENSEKNITVDENELLRGIEKALKAKFDLESAVLDCNVLYAPWIRGKNPRPFEQLTHVDIEIIEVLGQIHAALLVFDSLFARVFLPLDPQNDFLDDFIDGLKDEKNWKQWRLAPEKLLKDTANLISHLTALRLDCYPFGGEGLRK